MEEPRIWVQQYYGSFDGLRAVAILCVFFCHFGQFASPHLKPALWWTGVDLFFVLSGFLITGILYESKEQPHYFRNFYVRRALRILPLYWGLFLALGLEQVLVRREWPHYLWVSLLFLQNLFLRAIYLRHFPNVTVFAFRRWHTGLELGPMWSLCVEEQFYAIWPLVVYAVPSKQRLFRVSVLAAVVVLILRSLVYHLDPVAASTGYLYSQPFARFDSLLIGAALNLYLRQHKISRASLRHFALAVFAGLSALLIAVLLACDRSNPFNQNNPAIQTVGFTLIACIAGAVLLLALDDHSMLSRFLRLSAMRHLGRISYGFYFFHYFFAPLAGSMSRHLPGSTRLLVLPVMFGLCYTVAYLSFTYWESVFLRLKARLAPSSHVSVPVPTRPEELTLQDQHASAG